MYHCAGEWLAEKHGTSRRRSWRKLHIGIDAGSGEIVAIELTRKEIDDAARTGALLDQLADPLASFTADGAYDQERVDEAVAEHDPDAAVVVASTPYIRATRSRAASVWSSRNAPRHAARPASSPKSSTKAAPGSSRPWVS
jgi:Transposase DDE domain